MDSGGDIDMDEWRRKKAAEEQAKKQSMIEQVMALNAEDPRSQSLMSGASGGPGGGVAGSLQHILYLRHLAKLNKLKEQAVKAGKYVGRQVYDPVRAARPASAGQGPNSPTSTPPPRIPARPAGGGHLTPRANTALEWAGAGGVGYGASKILNPSTPQETVVVEADRPPVDPIPRQFDPSDGMGVNTNMAGPFSPNMLEAIRSGGAPQHEGMSKRAFVPLAEDKEKLTIDPTNTFTENPVDTPSLWKTWGSLADNPKERRKAYLASVKTIYRKKMLLDGIAQLTGGVSQGPAWAAMALAELDAMEKFDSEEILDQQHKALFFREDGAYDPPKNREEAIKRGQLLEYSLDQMKDILSIYPTKADNRTTLEKNLELLDSYPVGSPRHIALREKLLGTSGDKTNIQKRFEYYETLGFTDKELAQSARYDAGIAARPATETIKKPSIQQKIEYLVAEYNISKEDGKIIALMDAGLISKEGTDKSYSARARMLNLYLTLFKHPQLGGLIRGTEPFDVWLSKPEIQKQLNALLGVSNPNSSVIGGSLDEGDIDWNVTP
jgi:hypothetical protein